MQDMNRFAFGGRLASCHQEGSQARRVREVNASPIYNQACCTDFRDMGANIELSTGRHEELVGITDRVGCIVVVCGMGCARFTHMARRLLS